MKMNEMREAAQRQAMILDLADEVKVMKNKITAIEKSLIKHKEIERKVNELWLGRTK